MHLGSWCWHFRIGQSSNAALRRICVSANPWVRARLSAKRIWGVTYPLIVSMVRTVSACSQPTNLTVSTASKLALHTVMNSQLKLFHITPSLRLWLQLGISILSQNVNGKPVYKNERVHDKLNSVMKFCIFDTYNLGNWERIKSHSRYDDMTWQWDDILESEVLL